MSAADYPVTFPYGATTDGYSPASPHRGNDRPCPQGTEVYAGSTLIGLTGTTGRSSGPHLHIQEWNGNVANVRKPQNEFKGGTVIQVGTSSDFGIYVSVQTADGWVDSYCHLSEAKVKVGDKAGMADKIDQNLSRVIQHGILGRNGLRGRTYALDGTQGDPWVGGELTAQFIMDVFNSPEARQWRDSNDSNSVAGINATIDQVNALKNENEQLKKQLADGGDKFEVATVYVKKQK